MSMRPLYWAADDEHAKEMTALRARAEQAERERDMIDLRLQRAVELVADFERHGSISHEAAFEIMLKCGGMKRVAAEQSAKNSDDGLPTADDVRGIMR